MTALKILPWNPRLLALPTLALCLALTGCGGGDALTDAKKTLDTTFGAIQRGDYQNALTYYSPNFFASTPREEWANTLQVVLQTYGRFRGYEVAESFIEKTRGLDGGTYVALQCRVAYENGTINEDILLVRKRGQKKYEIQGHAINTRPQEAVEGAARQ